MCKHQILLMLDSRPLRSACGFAPLQVARGVRHPPQPPPRPCVSHPSWAWLPYFYSYSYFYLAQGREKKAQGLKITDDSDLFNEIAKLANTRSVLYFVPLKENHIKKQIFLFLLVAFSKAIWGSFPKPL